jgi:hypothetical protein
MSNKNTNKNGKGNKVAPVVAPVEAQQTDNTLLVQEVSSIEAALQADATAQQAVTVATTNESKKAKYYAIANVHPLQRLQDEQGTNYAPKNKGALMAALWYAVAGACGYTDVKRWNASIGTVCSKLAAHAVTHCASKGKALAGAEVSDNGAVGYARALKGALTGESNQHALRFSQYLQGGKYHDKALAEQALASLLVRVHGSTEGIDSAKRALSAVTVG